MKRVLSYALTFATVLFLGSTNVFADGYWEEYFKDTPITGYTGCGLNGPYYLSDWQNMTKEETIRYGGCGGYGPGFNPVPGTWNLVFDNTQNITIKSSNENIVTATTKPYDFSYEKNNYETYIEKFNKLTFEEFLRDYEGCMDNDGNFSQDSQYCNTEYKTKPTWWEYSEYKTEPKTWWEAYGLSKEPENATEVISYAKDLGNATLTLSASGKQDITIDWTIKAYDFGQYVGPKSAPDMGKGLAQILNNLEKYKDLIPIQTDYDTNKAYNFTYYISEKEDLSEAINALKGKDITILFIQDTNIGESTYFLNGKEIKNEVGEGFTYNHNISMETSINKDKIDSLVDVKDAIYIDFTYHGNLPTEYKLSVNIKEYIRSQIRAKLIDQYCAAFKDYKDDEEYAKLEKCWNDNNLTEKHTKELEEYLNNTAFTLLYYNPEKDEMEVVAENLKAVDDKIELTFDHFSSYVLTTNFTRKEKKSNNAQTGTLNVVLYGTLGALSLAGMVAVFLKNQKKNRE